MAWTILTALDAGVIDEVFVSTDSPEYAAIAEEYGANVPFLRPSELSADDSPASGYILHVLKTYRELRGSEFDYFILLQPTTPLRTPDDIGNGIRTAVDGGFSSVVSFCEYDADMRLVCRLPEDMSLVCPVSPNDTVRQGADRMYKVNGLIYVSACGEYEKSRSFYGERGRAILTDRLTAVDIDDETDFLFAEFLALKSGRF